MAAAHAATTGRVVDAAALYGPTLAFRDITDGDNGAPCLAGFDLGTGRGAGSASRSVQAAFRTATQAGRTADVEPDEVGRRRRCPRGVGL